MFGQGSHPHTHFFHRTVTRETQTKHVVAAGAATPHYLLLTQRTGRSAGGLPPARLAAGLRPLLAEDASRAARQVRHRALQASVAVALSAGEHAAAWGAGLAAPAADGAAGGGGAGTKAVPPRAVEAVRVSPGPRDAELQPLQEGDDAWGFGRDTPRAEAGRW